ncbi:ATP-binding protein [Candidatus Manganitrophus noduliformans]|uniref:histidine kinase n=1 Tax=Candidatus Manganitrophus noduliformans TaxID=2606439 RepID=A0A7X6DQ45_9BACT|nr:ATP-binding protein [Candidatus Manganitrophus noduliformans]NKE71322.1 response regulator [Candidatus Manganitrophus noduliformans]
MIGLKYGFLAFATVVSFSTAVLIFKHRRPKGPHAALSLGSFFTSGYLVILLLIERDLDSGVPPVPWLNLFQGLIGLIVSLSVVVAAVLPQAYAKFRRAILPFSVLGFVISAISLSAPLYSDTLVVRRYSELFFKSAFSLIFDLYVFAGQCFVLAIIAFQYRICRSEEIPSLDKRIVRTLARWVGLRGALFWISIWLLIQIHEEGASEKWFVFLNAGGSLITMGIFIHLVIRHRAFDIETVVHKTASWLIVSSVPLVALIWGAAWLRPWLVEYPDSTWGMWIGGISFAAALYLYIAQPFVDQLFDRRKYDLQKTLDQVIAELAVLQELQPMSQKILREVGRVLSVESAEVLLLNSRSESPRRAAEWNGPMEKIGPVPLVVWERLQEGSVVQIASSRFARPEEEEVPATAWLKEHHFALCLPLIQKGELLGTIALGRKRNMKRFSRREVDFLSRIGAASTIAFSNSLLLEQVRNLDRQKTEFLSDVVHELRGPLLGMASIAEGILAHHGTAAPENQRRLIEDIRLTALDMKDLVDHLLDLSKIEMGVMTYDFREIELESVVRLAVDLAGGAITSKGLELAVQMDEPLPMVKGDKSRIRQCVTNLLSNAVKYTDHGTILVSCAKAEGGVQVVVEDTGRGMSQEEIRSLFTRYRRGDQVSGIEGSGLGLALTKEIVEAHRGRIDVESEAGQGTRISIFLPENQPEALQSDPAPPTGRAADPNGKRTELTNGTKGSLPRAVMGQGETLLIADDSEIDRDVLQSFFEANGYRIVTAANGREALRRIREEVPDLIITDMIMPNLSGPQLCRMLKDNLNTASIPIIMVTARDNLGEMAFDFELGADDYAPKPCNLKELSLRVAMLLRINRIRNDLETARSRLIEMELIASSSGTLVHAIKVPLALIQNYVKIVRSEFVSGNPEEAHEGLSHISEAAEDIAGILHGLRRAHIDPPKMVRVDLAEVVEACISDRTEEISKPSYRIVKRYGENIPRVQGDQAQLGMAFANLIANAFDAMPDGGTLEVILSMAGREGVEIKIRDSGAGIPETVRKNLFKPFITTKAHGTGLGLWTAKRVIENNHGGELSLASIPGAGTAAIVRLPLVGRMKTDHQKEVIEHGERPDSDR